MTLDCMSVLYVKDSCMQKAVFCQKVRNLRCNWLTDCEICLERKKKDFDETKLVNVVQTLVLCFCLILFFQKWRAMSSSLDSYFRVHSNSYIRSVMFSLHNESVSSCPYRHYIRIKVMANMSINQ